MYERVRDVIAEILEITDKNEITRETNIIEDLGADSLDVVEMITTLEREAGTVIPDDVMATLRTVGDVADLLDRMKGNK